MKKYFPAYNAYVDDNLDSIIEQYMEEISELNVENKEDSIIKEPIISSYEAYNCVKKLERFFMQNEIETVQKIWEIEDIIIKERRNWQPKITDFICKTK